MRPLCRRLVTWWSRPGSYVRGSAVLAVLAVGCFAVLAQVELRGRDDHRQVGLAAQQVALAQQVGAQALLSVAAATQAERAGARTALGAAVEQMRAGRGRLLDGDGRTRLRPASDEESAWLRGDDGAVAAALETFWADAELVATSTSASPPVEAAAARLATAAAGALGAELAAVARAYEQAGVGRSTLLHRLIVAFGGGLVIASAAVLVPMGRALRRERAALIEASRVAADREQFLSDLLETMDVAVFAVDAQGAPTLVNEAGRRLHGLPRGAEPPGPGAYLGNMRFPESDEVVGLTDLPSARAMRDGPVRGLELAIVTGSQRRSILVNSTAIRSTDGRLLGGVTAAHDVTELKVREAQLEEAAAFHDAVLAATPDLVFVNDVATRSNLWSSRNLADMMGWTPEQVREMGADLYQRILHPDDLAAVVASTDSAARLADGEVQAMRYRVRRADGSYRWMSNRATPFRRDDAGRVTQLLGVARDVTETVEAEERLALAAVHDSLTGLPNRTLLGDRLRAALSRRARGGGPVVVLYGDLDGFKRVNDTCGHSAGDAVLVETADRLRRVLRPSDTAARVGGDEFVVVLDMPPATGAAAARAEAVVVADRLAAALRVPFCVDGREHAVTVSLGVCLAHVGSDPEAALREADRAMYRAKALGKDRCEVTEVGVPDPPTVLEVDPRVTRA